MYRLIAATVLVVSIFFSYYFVYNTAFNKGEEAVHSLWTKDKLQQSQQALLVQQQLQQEKQKSDERYANEKRKAAVAVSAAKSELDRLRDELTSRREEGVGAGPSTRANGISGLERELLGQCATTLVSVAAEADRLEAVVVGLQSYITNICLSK
jgi:hypothetical protein